MGVRMPPAPPVNGRRSPHHTIKEGRGGNPLSRHFHLASQFSFRAALVHLALTPTPTHPPLLSLMCAVSSALSRMKCFACLALFFFGCFPDSCGGALAPHPALFLLCQERGFSFLRVWGESAPFPAGSALFPAFVRDACTGGSCGESVFPCSKK
eukprot:RCo031803